jgi:hypothetical protein
LRQDCNSGPGAPSSAQRRARIVSIHWTDPSCRQALRPAADGPTDEQPGHPADYLSGEKTILSFSGLSGPYG